MESNVIWLVCVWTTCNSFHLETHWGDKLTSYSIQKKIYIKVL